MKEEQGSWVAYLVTQEGEFVEIGWADDMERANTLMFEYFRDGIEGHPHRFFRALGVSSKASLEYVRREHGV